MTIPKPNRSKFGSRIKDTIQSIPFHIIFILVYFLGLVILKEFIPGFDNLRGYLYVILISLAGICFGLKGGLIFSALSILIYIFQENIVTQGALNKTGAHDFYINSVVYVLAGIVIGSFSELERDIKKRLQVLAQFDGLTNCYNYRRIIELLEQELSRSKRYGRSFTIILLDIDFFKKINDMYGHLVGNNVLKSFAQNLTTSLRDIDIVGRYGGEEFLVILPETTIDECPRILERIKSKMKHIVVTSPYLKAPLNLSIKFSAGVAACPTDGANANQMISMVDSALYEAKRSGRDKAIIEKRSAIRFKQFSGLSISLVDFSANKEYEDVFLINVSPGGFKIKLDQNLEKHKFLARISLPGEDLKSEANCEICYKQKTTTGQYNIGFRFTDMSVAVQDKIYACCTSINNTNRP
ncbi:MAG: diguanylate cyclase [Candidatus Omnitrophota bacterium]